MTGPALSPSSCAVSGSPRLARPRSAAPRFTIRYLPGPNYLARILRALAVAYAGVRPSPAAGYGPGIEPGGTLCHQTLAASNRTAPCPDRPPAHPPVAPHSALPR